MKGKKTGRNGVRMKEKKRKRKNVRNKMRGGRRRRESVEESMEVKDERNKLKRSEE